MAILTILEYPDPRLRKVAAPVAAVTPDIERLVRDMADTMYAAPGVGLAATQVDVHKRVIVMDVSEARDELRVFINPEILAADGEAENEEGCLSVPGYYDKVTRAARDPRARARRRAANRSSSRPTGVLAVCIQHEMDHLMGTGLRRSPVAAEAVAAHRAAAQEAAADGLRRCRAPTATYHLREIKRLADPVEAALAKYRWDRHPDQHPLSVPRLKIRNQRLKFIKHS